MKEREEINKNKNKILPCPISRPPPETPQPLTIYGWTTTQKELHNPHLHGHRFTETRPSPPQKLRPRDSELHHPRLQTTLSADHLCRSFFESNHTWDRYLAEETSEISQPLTGPRSPVVAPISDRVMVLFPCPKSVGAPCIKEVRDFRTKRVEV